MNSSMEVSEIIGIISDGEALQVVPNKVKLRSIFNPVGDKRILVISVCGPKRQGRTFLINFVLRCLKAMQQGSEDGLGWDAPENPLEGFPWSVGSEQVTTGIWLTSEPIMMTDSNGVEMAVFLMDTQGCDSAEAAFILELCIQVSGITIFNTINDITEKHILALAEAIESAVNNGQSQFGRLHLVIRDWAASSRFPFGEVGRQQYRNELLSSQEAGREELLHAKEILGNHQVECHLLPNPGNKIHEPLYNGNLTKPSPQFLNELETFLLDILDLSNLEVSLTGKECMKRFEKYGTAKSKPRTADTSYGTGPSLGATAPSKNRESLAAGDNSVSSEDQFKEACTKILKEYKTNVAAYINDTKHGFLAPAVLQNVHEKFADAGVDQLASSEIQGTFKLALKYDKFLREELEKAFQDISEPNSKKREKCVAKWDKALNNCLELYEARTQALFMGKVLSKGLVKTENKFQVIEIQEKFKSMVKRIEGDEEFLEQYSEKLVQGMTEMYEVELNSFVQKRRAKLNREFDNCKIIAEAKYIDQMNNFVKSNYNEYSVEQLKKFHMEAVNKVMLNVNLPEDDVFNDTCYESFMREFLKNQLSSILQQKETVASAYAKYVTPAFEHFKGDVADLISLPENLSSDEFQSRRRSMKTDTIEHVKSKITGLEEEDIVSQVIEKLTQQIDESLEEDLARFNKRKQIVEQQQNNLVSEMVNKYQNQMESKMQALPSKQELENAHRYALDSVLGELKEKRQDPSLVFAIDDALSRRVRDELKLASEVGKETYFKNHAENCVQTIFCSYKEELNGKKWDSVDQLKEFHQTRFSAAEEELKNRCEGKEPGFLEPFISKLQKEMETLFKGLLPQMELAIQQELMLIKTQMGDAADFYRREMEKHFDNMPFVKPADFLAKHHGFVRQVVEKFGKKLSDSQKEKLKESLKPLYHKYLERNTMNTPCDDAAIGIDLGTTYSCVAIYNKGEVKIIADTYGKNTVPSFVACTPQGLLIGEAAKDQAHENPTETIFDAKRLIGRTFDEKEVQKDIKHWPFKVQQQPGTSKPVVVTKGIERPPEFISSQILQHIKKMAEKYTGKAIEKAVITVPAYFNDGQRQATKDAGEIAGLDVLQILNEPTAAAMAYYLQHQAGVNELKEPYVLVYDLGGGTFDVSVLKMIEGNIRVLAVNGDTHLGGEDFDSNLVNFCAQKFKGETGIDLFIGRGSTEEERKAKAARQLRRLRNECEKRKKDLSEAQSSNVLLDAIVDGIDLNVLITRKDFEDMNRTLFQKTISIVKKAMSDAKLQPSQIDEVVLVGGSSRIPKIQAMLKGFFGGKELCRSLNPDEAVAYGAAVLAAKLNGQQEQRLKKISLEDVAPLSVGIRVADGTLSVILPRNAKLPAKVVDKNYVTARDNQTEVTIAVFEGEERVANDNHFLGEFMLTNIPPRPRGAEQIHVTMEINEQGILHVTARVGSTGETSDIVIKEDKGRLTRDEINTLRLELA